VSVPARTAHGASYRQGGVKNLDASGVVNYIDGDDGRCRRRNARDQAGSHHHLLDLLESGDIDSAVAHLAEHLSGAEDAILERLDLA
jgi:hypothetical protein